MALPHPKTRAHPKTQRTRCYPTTQCELTPLIGRPAAVKRPGGSGPSSLPLAPSPRSSVPRASSARAAGEWASWAGVAEVRATGRQATHSRRVPLGGRAFKRLTYNSRSFPSRPYRRSRLPMVSSALVIDSYHHRFSLVDRVRSNDLLTRYREPGLENVETMVSAILRVQYPGGDC